MTSESTVKAKQVTIIGVPEIDSSGIPIVFEQVGQPLGSGAPIILVIHALTGNSHAKSTLEDSTPGWWEDFVGEGPYAINTNDFTVLIPNLPGSCYGSWQPVSSEPTLSVHQIALILTTWLRKIGVKEVEAAIGGSLGGMVAAQLALESDLLIRKVVLLSSCLYQPAWARAWGHLELTAIQQARNPEDGLSLARQIAMLSYRAPIDFEQKHSILKPIDSYLSYQGWKFNERFDSKTYQILVKAMDTFDLRESIPTTKTEALIIGNEQDFLYPVQEQIRLQEKFPLSKLFIFSSDKGHDAFLTDHQVLNPVINEFLSWRTQ